MLEPNVPPSVKVAEDDDLDLCLYYLRTLYHILQYSGQVSWSVLMSQHLIFGHGLVSIGGKQESRWQETKANTNLPSFSEQW